MRRWEFSNLDHRRLKRRSYLLGLTNSKQRSRYIDRGACGRPIKPGTIGVCQTLAVETDSRRIMLPGGIQVSQVIETRGHRGEIPRIPGHGDAVFEPLAALLNLAQTNIRTSKAGGNIDNEPRR